VRSATAHTPAVLFASGTSALESARRLRELLPGLPAVIRTAESDLPGLVEELGADPAVLLPTTVGTAALAIAIRALVPPKPDAARPAEESTIEPRSYAHLAGLLPRALARTIDFDVGAAVIARPGGEPLVDVHAAAECADAALESVRQRALALFRMVSGRPQKEDQAAHPPAPAPFRSSIYVPLATEGRVVGLTYLASLRPDAFSEQDERVLADLAAHASGAYRQLEASVRHLRLTPRQSQVLALIASGLSDKEVATRLGLAHRTVRTHVDRLLREHGLHSRTEAVAAWLRGKQG
jgi:DNA-binding CsgD family transcriptional regulator